MCDNSTNKSVNAVIHPLLPKSSKNVDCETAEEAATTDSEEYLAESLRYRNFQCSTRSNDSNITVVPKNMTISEENGNFYPTVPEIDVNNIQVPIVGYEIMEERARFTVYKLKVENKATGDFWFVFRRYTDFVRLCNRLRNKHPEIVQYLPRKRYLKNNFDPIFLDERVNGLQTLVNAIIHIKDLVSTQEVQDFFCLNEPPLYSETSEESRAIFEALEETISDLRQQLHLKESTVDALQTKLHSLSIENDNLRKLIRNSSVNCERCRDDYESYTNQLK